MKNTIVAGRETDFFFKAFEEASEPVSGDGELVVLPETRIHKSDYIARVLSNNHYVHDSKMFQEIINRFVKISKQENQGEYNSAIIKVLRSVFGLDKEHSIGYQKQEISDEQMQDELNETLLEAAVADLSEQCDYPRFYVCGATFRERFANTAKEVSYRVGLLADEESKGNGKAEESEEDRFTRNRSLETKIKEHERELLRIQDIKVIAGMKDIAQTIMQAYPILDNSKIRNQLANGIDLCYTICAALAPEIIQTPEYRDATIEVVRARTLPQLKFIYSMMALCQDNFLRLGNLDNLGRVGNYGRKP